MAIDINLNIYAPGHNNVRLMHLYFGQKLLGLGAKFRWIKSVGMSVDGPSAYEDDTALNGYNVAKEHLGAWIDDGYLSRFPEKNDSSEFLNEYPNNSIFKLWFVDWS